MTLGGLLTERASRHPKSPAVLSDPEVLSYEELNEATTALARRLLDLGLRPGDRVAIHWSNAVTPVKLFFACFQAGLVAVPVNTRLKASEIAYVLAHSEARVCFSQPELADAALEAIASLAPAPRLFTELPASGGRADDLPAVDPSHPAAILYTSGTTANPKGVTHTHRTLSEMARLIGGVIGEQSVSRILVTTSMMHIGGFAWDLLVAIFHGGAVVPLPAFEAAAALDLIQRFRCTYTVALPAMIRFLMEEQTRQPRDVSSLRCFLGAGDSVPIDSQQQFPSLFGVPLLECMAMTETSPISWNTAWDHRPGSLGKPRNGIELHVATLTGGHAADGEVGELAVRSPANFVGYWHDAEATAAALRDGWLHTGDLVRRDALGYYWFEGRKKQIIIRGGSNISPQQVEEVLYRHPAVLETGVIGAPDPIFGEQVVAFISLRPGCSVSGEQLREFAREQLADYKVPQQIIFLDALPKNATGKVQRRLLKEMMVSDPRLAQNA